MIAAKYGHHEMVSLFIFHKAVMEGLDERGWIVFHYALFGICSFNVVSFLVAHGANIDVGIA